MSKDYYRPEGSWVALITPFTSDNKVDIDGYKQLIDFQAANGTSTLLIMGSTGEPTLLSIEERKTIIRELSPVLQRQNPCIFRGHHGVHRSHHRPCALRSRTTGPTEW